MERRERAKGGESGGKKKEEGKRSRGDKPCTKKD